MAGIAPVSPIGMSKPKYLESVRDNTFGIDIRRIGFDTGVELGGAVGGLGHEFSRHRYSRIPAWSKSGKYLFIEQKGASDARRPSKVIVDGESYLPIVANKYATLMSMMLATTSDARWSSRSESEMIATSSSAPELVLFDVIRDVELKRIRHGLVGGNYTNEGCPSRDSSVVAIGNDDTNEVVLVNIDTGFVGPLHVLDLLGGSLGNVTVSKLSTAGGGTVIAKASGSNEWARVFDFGPELKLVPRQMADDGLRMGASKARTDGFIAKMSHADVAVTLDGREVWVGGVRGSSDVNIDYDKERDGRIVAIDLTTGRHTCISPGTARGVKSAADEHCSSEIDGFVVASMYATGDPDEVFVAEIVVLPLDGSQEPLWRVPHRSTGKPYEAEVQARHHPTNINRLIFASNWNGLGGAPSDTVESKAYIAVRSADDGGPPPPDPTPPAPRYHVDLAWTMYGGVIDTTLGRPLDAHETARRLNMLAEGKSHP